MVKKEKRIKVYWMSITDVTATVRQTDRQTDRPFVLKTDKGNYLM